MTAPAGVWVPILGRALTFLGTVVGATVFVHVLLALVPGDAIDTLPNGDVLRPLLAAEWGLDQPLGKRILSAILRAFSGDLGTSLTTRPGAPVANLILAAAPASIALVSAATLAALAAAIATVGASQRFAGLLPAISFLTAIPTALAALLVINGINALTFDLIESGSITRPDWFALPAQDSPLRTALAVVLLACCSSQLGNLAGRAENARSALTTAGFVTAERARGGPVGPLLARHLAVPVLRATSAGVPAMLSGLIVIERSFGLGGCGALFWTAVRERDWPLAAALAASAALLVAGIRLCVDIFAVLWDPRERQDA